MTQASQEGKVFKATYQMDESSCCQPSADKYGQQIHQLDGIAVQRRQRERGPKLQKGDPLGTARWCHNVP